MKTKITFFAVLLFSVMTLHAKDEVFYPTDDTYIHMASFKTDNYGDSPDLEVRFTIFGEWRRDIFIKFDISDSEFTTPYEKAYLRLFGHDEGVVVPMRVLKISSDMANYNWSENSLIFSNRPVTDWKNDSIAQITTEGDYIEKYFEWDVTNWVNAEKAAGRNTINMQVRQLNYPDEPNEAVLLMKFHSKENESGNKPQLVLVGNASSVSEVNAQKNNIVISNGILTTGENNPVEVEIISMLGITVKKAIVDASGMNVSDLKGPHIVRANGFSKAYSF